MAEKKRSVSVETDSGAGGRLQYREMIDKLSLQRTVFLAGMAMGIIVMTIAAIVVTLLFGIR